MMCFSMAWLMQLLILAVVCIAIYAILIQILLPYVLSKIGAGEVSQGANVLVAILRIVFWAIIVIFVIYIAFALIACLWSFAGGGFSLMPHR